MYDAVVVGGGVSGLTAALTLGRGRRRVLVFDAGEPRNTPAAHAHGFLTRDGVPPLEILRLAREELKNYPNVEIAGEDVVSAVAARDGFSVATRDRAVKTRKIVLATGVVDVLPDIPGVRELWGQGIYHCPYCHGWEIRDKPWAILGDALVLDRVTLFRGWASSLTVLANGPSVLGGEEKQRLLSLAELDERRIARIEGINGTEVTVTFEDGVEHSFGGVFVMPHQIQRSKLAEELGCEFEEFEPTATRYVKADSATAESSVRGVYAIGDMATPLQSLTLAAASGARAAAHLNRALAMEDADAVIARKGMVAT